MATVPGQNEYLTECTAKARLIAAAPELLAACKRAENLLSCVPQIPNYEGQSLQCLHAFIEAIKKAEGK